MWTLTLRYVLLIRRGDETDAGRSHVKTEAEIRVGWLQDKEHPGLMGVTESQEESKENSSLGPWGKHESTNVFIVWTSAS